ncbi:hypothetical protein [Hymenobacter rigui]|uniref:Outer membrane protein beta-barrel domain-containing protein n=1 Tax=Hymenobacter rigui TaxID=334424 RepID=A0A428KUR1_9BACT|nr:hypothetical protein [Hymenobacter rigui]RSK50351.1 hypothetical protein EI291_06800 [Hymenobacter rigui]
MSCAAYRPITPHLPTVHAKQEAEVTAGVDGNHFANAQAAYSPVNHLLLTTTVGGSLQRPGKPSTQDQSTQRHARVGLGVYLPLDSTSWLTVTGGGGTAHSFVSALSSPYLNQFTTVDSRQLYGLIGLQKQLTSRYVLCSIGLAYEATLLNYRRYSVLTTRQTETGEEYQRDDLRYPVPNLLRHAVWGQLELGSRNFPALQFRLNGGYSTASGPSTAATSALRSVIREEKNNEFLAQASVVFYPHLLKKKR